MKRSTNNASPTHKVSIFLKLSANCSLYGLYFCEKLVPIGPYRDHFGIWTGVRDTAYALLHSPVKNSFANWLNEIEKKTFSSYQEGGEAKSKLVMDTPEEGFCRTIKLKFYILKIQKSFVFFLKIDW